MFEPELRLCEQRAPGVVPVWSCLLQFGSRDVLSHELASKSKSRAQTGHGRVRHASLSGGPRHWRGLAVWGKA